jgi:hypothetical protein
MATSNPQYGLDLNDTFRITGANKLWLGGTSGAADADASIYRSAAGELTISTNLVVIGAATITNAALTTPTITGATMSGTISGGTYTNAHGLGITNLSADNIATGTLADARLSANVALLNGTNSFTRPNNFTLNVGFGTASPMYNIDVIGTGRFSGANRLWFGGTSGNADADVSFQRTAAGEITVTTNLVVTGLKATKLRMNGVALGTSTEPAIFYSPPTDTAADGAHSSTIASSTSGSTTTQMYGWRLGTDFSLNLDRLYGSWQSTPVMSVVRADGTVGFGVTTSKYGVDVGSTLRVVGANKLWLGGTANNADADASINRSAAGMLTVTTNITVTGSITTGTLTKTANYTLLEGDGGTLFADATGGAVTITLPAAAAGTVGREYKVFKVDSSGNAVNIAPNGSNLLLAGSTTNTTAQASCLRVTGYSSTAWIVNKTN